MDDRRIRGIVNTVVTAEAGGIRQEPGLARLRCRLVGDAVEVFAIGRWRPVANGRKLPLTRRKLAEVKKRLNLNGGMREGDRLELIYE